mmetsp:Transcript_54992/g.131075  ORF Transcript_54992/g.131075 Transcript_54992/m.131075 type:complete len:271 (-) Transcript_54992:159-971(-)
MDVFVGGERIAADLHMDWRVEEIVCQSLYLLRPCGAEHHGLSALGHMLHDVSNLRLEAHVQHAICLIEDHIANVAEIHLLVTEEIVQPAWCCHQDGRPSPNGRELLPLGLPTVDAAAGEARPLGKLRCLVVDLRCELSCGCIDQSAHHSLPRFGRHPDVSRNQEGQCFARTSFGNANCIPTQHESRPHLSLDGRWCFESSCTEGLLQLRWKVEVIVGRRRRRHFAHTVGCPRSDIILQPIWIGFLVVAASDLLVRSELLGSLLHVTLRSR